MAIDSEKNSQEEVINFDDFVLSDDIIDIKSEEDFKEETQDEKSDETEKEVEETEESEDDGKEEEESDDTKDDEETEEVEEEEEEEEKETTDEEAEEDLGNGFKSIIQMMHEENGWEYNEDDFKDSDSIDGLNGFLREVIEANSQPEYASEETAKFDAFVKEHGVDKASEFLEANYGQVDYENVDLEDDGQLKNLMRDYLKETTKFSDKKIEKQVQKAEELGELAEEGEEMKSHMLEVVKQRAEDVEKRAVEEKEARRQEFQSYLNTQKKRIEDADEIAGFKFSDKDKEGLYKFAYEPGRDGKTGYERLKDSDKDIDLKLLALAYKGVDKAKISKEAESEVTKKLKKELSRHKDLTTGKSKVVKSPKKNTNKGDDTNYDAFVFKK